MLAAPVFSTMPPAVLPSLITDVRGLQENVQFLARRVVTVLLAQSLLLSTTFAQQQTPAETRPRRTHPHGRSRLLQHRSFRHRTSPSLLVLNRESAALSTDSRSAVISTTGHLMNASGGGSTLLALDSSRVRVDPRLLSPSARVNDDAAYRVIVAGATSHAEADDIGDEIEKLIGEDTDETFDTETKTWGVASGRNVRVKKRRS